MLIIDQFCLLLYQKQSQSSYVLINNYSSTDALGRPCHLCGKWPNPYVFGSPISWHAAIMWKQTDANWNYSVLVIWREKSAWCRYFEQKILRVGQTPNSIIKLNIKCLGWWCDCGIHFIRFVPCHSKSAHLIGVTEWQLVFNSFYAPWRDILTQRPGMLSKQTSIFNWNHSIRNAFPCCCVVCDAAGLIMVMVINLRRHAYE